MKFYLYELRAGIPTLKIEGNTITDDLDKTNALNNQFVLVFTQEDISIILDIPGPPYPAMDTIEITIEGVTRLLTNLNPNKASGPDKISNRFLKDFAAEITPCLTMLFQASLNQGTIPNDWKKAFVTPIFKKGDRSSPANYQPISLTSAVCKILEHIISSNIYTHLDNHKILTE